MMSELTENEPIGKKPGRTSSEQQKALVRRLDKLGFFVRLENGFVDYDATGGVDLLADGCFISITPGIKAAYFSPNLIEDNDGLLVNIIGMTEELARCGKGICYRTRAGHKWLIFNQNEYREFCKMYQFEEDEFRLYPQE